jgi:F-type H+-transporting ATPase subunit gamma
MRLAEIERHAASMEELQRIVGAMRAIASMRMQEAVRALASVREYGSTLGEALHDALAIVGEEGGPPVSWSPRPRLPRRAIVLFAGEHGFVGGFNQRLMEALESDLTRTDALMIVGTRGAAFATERGHEATWSHPLATRLAGITDTVRVLEEELLPRISIGEIVRVDVIFGSYGRSGQIEIERRRLFPLTVAAAGRDTRGLAPLHDLPAAELLEKLTLEYLLAELTEAATEALAAENAARFAAMESARDNVGRRLETLRLDAARARQEEVTAELLDLITAEQALR